MGTPCGGPAGRKTSADWERLPRFHAEYGDRKHRAVPALQALPTPSPLPSRKAEPALRMPGWGQYPNEKDGATGQREGGSEAEGKFQRRQTSKGLIKITQRLYFQVCHRQRDRQLWLTWDGLTLSSTRVRRGLYGINTLQGDTVTIGMMRQQAMEAHPN